MKKTVIKWILDIHDKETRDKALSLLNDLDGITSCKCSGFDNAIRIICQYYPESREGWEFFNGLLYNPSIRLASEIKSEWEQQYDLLISFIEYADKIRENEIYPLDVINYLNQKHGIQHEPK